MLSFWDQQDSKQVPTLVTGVSYLDGSPQINLLHSNEVMIVGLLVGFQPGASEFR